ncbi:hypothetical protein LUZ60_014463 [Juncus effusus]|nr:hypothetical protein LUZ60_014463 [Juncus effusus]
MTIELRENYDGRITPYVIFSCIIAATGGLLFGYDLGISGGVTSMETFLNHFFPTLLKQMSNHSTTSNYCEFNSQLLTLFTSSLYLAGLLATFPAAWVTRNVGRRASMLAGGAAFLVGAIIGGFAFNIGMLIAGRVLLGVGVGFANQAVPLYLSEMAPSKYRGAINNGFEVCVGLGVFIANLINYRTQKLQSNKGWRLSLILAAIPALILSLGALFIPETPNSIIQRTKSKEKARKKLQKMRGTQNVEEELNGIIAAGSTASNNSHSIFQRKHRPQVIMSAFIAFFQQATGINVITFYSPIIFRIIGLGESSSLLSTLITGIIGIISIFIAMVLVDKLGRRTLFIAGGVLMFVTHILVGIILVTQLGDYGGISQGYAYVVLVLICIYVGGFGISWGPLGWLVPSEILPLEIRSSGQSLVVAVGLFFAFLLAQVLLSLLCHMKSGVFFFFGGWVLVMTVFVIVLLPETKGLPIEKVEKVWGEHWFWKNWTNGEEGVKEIDVATL